MTDPRSQDDPPLERLRRALPDLPPRLREVARFLDAHTFEASTRSMRALAALAGVNPASFTRLAQTLGYRGWDELRDTLTEAHRPQPPAPFSSRLPDPAGNAPAGPDGIVRAMLRADADGLGRIAEAPVRRAAAALHAAPEVWIAGFRSCTGVAELLGYQLRMFRPGSVRLVGGSGPEDLDFGAFEPGHAVVVIGFAPYSRASVATARAARSEGCTLIVLADRASAPMAAGADHLLLFEAAAGPGFFPSLTGAVAQARALAAATFVLGGERSLACLRRTEARLASHSRYVSEPDNSE